jgi:hypothetical protein
VQSKVLGTFAKREIRRAHSKESAMKLSKVAIAVVGLSTVVAHASPVKHWTGAFEPEVSVGDYSGRKLVKGRGTVRMASTDALPKGEVYVVVNPLFKAVGHAAMTTKKALYGEADETPVLWVGEMTYNKKSDRDAGVFVFPEHTNAKAMKPSAKELKAIRAAIVESKVLSAKAAKKLEVGGVDVDGDKQIDFAVTFGCNGEADGECQSEGQLFLERNGTNWVLEI